MCIIIKALKLEYTIMYIKKVEYIFLRRFSYSSFFVQVSEDGQKIRRSPEMPVPEMNEERRKELQTRTVYAKGLPRDSKLDDLLKFFQQHGEVDNLVMRKYLDRSKKQRIFKGSVFITFKNKEQVRKISLVLFFIILNLLQCMMVVVSHV